jgi:hypothetical protein
MNIVQIRFTQFSNPSLIVAFSTMLIKYLALYLVTDILEVSSQGV